MTDVKFITKPKRRGVYSTRSVADKIVLTVVIVLLLMVALSQMYVLFWMLYTSLKDDVALFLDMFALPKIGEFCWSNYSSILKLVRVSIFVPGKGYVSYGFGTLLRNSFLLTVFMPLQGQIVSTITAYILSKYRFKGRSFLLAVNFFVIIFPVVGDLASGLKINYAIGRYDNFIMMCVTGAHPFTGLNLLIQMSFYDAIPKEMMEAARIDGAGHFTTFFRIHFPLILPTFFLYYMLAVFASWNDYMTPLVWLPSFPNLALGMFQFQYDAAKYAATLPQVLAGFVIVSIPSVVFYLCNQKLITSRMVMSGLKG